MHRLAHEVESLLDLARNHRMRVNSGIITEILRSRDALQGLNHQVAEALESGRLPEQIVPVESSIAAVRGLAAEGIAGARESRPCGRIRPQAQSGRARRPPGVELASSKPAAARRCG